MQLPAFETIASPFAADAVTLIGVRRLDDVPVVEAVPGGEALGTLLEPLGVTGKAGEIVRTVLPAGGDSAGARVALVGFGDETPTPASWRVAAGQAARALATVDTVDVAVGDLEPDTAEQLAIGFALGGYRFDTYRSEQRPATTRLRLVTSEATTILPALERARVIASAVWLVRDLVNTPPNALSPASFAELATETGAGLGLDVEVLNEEGLAEGGFGGHLAVGAGSSRGPRLVTVRWRPEDAAARVELVGKGITFDSGGLSLKPAASMVGMKFDMSGAAVALGVVCAAAQLGLPVEVTARLCLAENLPSSTATRPDDIIVMRGGTTVEVTNTDAEGRLVLADGIALASEQAPDLIVDIATLTGAQVIALGDRTTGVMGNDDAWIGKLVEAAERNGEPAWHMPIPDEASSILSSDVADLANAKPGTRSAGMLTAAWFLEQFVGTNDGAAIPWMHLDIAGPSNNEKSAYGVTPAGATGVMTRTLVTLLEGIGDTRRN